MMRNFMMNRNGISPLLATIFLIAFAVSLAVVIVNIASFETKPVVNEAEVSEQDACRGVSIDFVVVGIPYICYEQYSEEEGVINFILENDGSRSISGLRITVLGEKGSFNRKFDLNESWLPLALLDRRNSGIDYSFNEYGKPLQVTFVPVVSYKGESFDCTSAFLKLDDPLECP